MCLSECICQYQYTYMHTHTYMLWLKLCPHKGQYPCRYKYLRCQKQEVLALLPEWAVVGQLGLAQNWANIPYIIWLLVGPLIFIQLLIPQNCNYNFSDLLLLFSLKAHFRPIFPIFCLLCCHETSLVYSLYTYRTFFGVY